MLQGVSRTFALTIPELPDSLRAVVGNAYLLCRITDTIEDEPALSVGQKQRLWRRFVDVLANRDDARDFARELGAMLSGSTTASEHELVANTPRVVRITNGFSASQRGVLERCVRIMSNGMKEFQQLDTSAGLASLMQMDRYCYFVAGVVGETLTELFCDYSVEMNDRRDELQPLAVSFGQGLQMTNILKDLWEDRRRGACWLPRDVFRETGFDLSGLRPGQNDRVSRGAWPRSSRLPPAPGGRHALHRARADSRDRDPPALPVGPGHGGSDPASHPRDAHVHARKGRQDLATQRVRRHCRHEHAGALERRSPPLFGAMTRDLPPPRANRSSRISP